MSRKNKDYKAWMKVKSIINNGDKCQRINEGDVVWTAIGENVGVEIDGKSEKYSRPVVVLKKHTGRCFTGIPLTSKSRVGTWYANFRFQGKDETAVLLQAKLFDTARVYSRIGRLSNADYKTILNKYIDLILK